MPRWPKNRMGDHLTPTQREIVRMRQSGYRKSTIGRKLGLRETQIDYAISKAIAIGYKVNPKDREVDTHPAGETYRIAGTTPRGWPRQVIGGTKEDAWREWHAVGGDIVEEGPA